MACANGALANDAPTPNSISSTKSSVPTADINLPPALQQWDRLVDVFEVQANTKRALERANKPRPKSLITMHQLDTASTSSKTTGVDITVPTPSTSSNVRISTINGRPSFMLETPMEASNVNGNSQELSPDRDDDDSGNNTMPHEWRDAANSDMLSLSRVETAPQGRIGGLASPGSEDRMINYRAVSGPPQRYENNINRSKMFGGTPWIECDSAYAPSVDGLHHEIIDFCQWIAPNPREFDVRWHVFNRIREIILRVYARRQEQCTVQYYGSFRTALFLPTSDIDLVILTPEQRRHEVPMDELAKELIDSGITTEKNLKRIPKASVPIIKFVDLDTDIHVDVSWNQRNGLNAAEVVTHYMLMYPCLRFLVYVVKQFLLQRGLNEVYSGGIGSYAIVLMCIAYLQFRNADMQTAPPHAGNNSLGRLLIEFFQHYGIHFDYKERCVDHMRGAVPAFECCSQGAFDYYYPPKSQIDAIITASSYFTILDPLDPSNDVGRSCFLVVHAQKAFARAYHCLSDYVLGGLPPPVGHSYLNSIIMITDSVVAYRIWLIEYGKALRSTDSLFGGAPHAPAGIAPFGSQANANEPAVIAHNVQWRELQAAFIANLMYMHYERSDSSAETRGEHQKRVKIASGFIESVLHQLQALQLKHGKECEQLVDRHKSEGPYQPPTQQQEFDNMHARHMSEQGALQAQLLARCEQMLHERHARARAAVPRHVQLPDGSNMAPPPPANDEDDLAYWQQTPDAQTIANDWESTASEELSEASVDDLEQETTVEGNDETTGVNVEACSVHSSEVTTVSALAYMQMRGIAPLTRFAYQAQGAMQTAPSWHGASVDGTPPRMPTAPPQQYRQQFPRPLMHGPSVSIVQPQPSFQQPCVQPRFAAWQPNVENAFRAEESFVRPLHDVQASTAQQTVLMQYNPRRPWSAPLATQNVPNETVVRRPSFNTKSTMRNEISSQPTPIVEAIPSTAANVQANMHSNGDAQHHTVVWPSVPPSKCTVSLALARSGTSTSGQTYSDVLRQKPQSAEIECRIADGWLKFNFSIDYTNTGSTTTALPYVLNENATPVNSTFNKPAPRTYSYVASVTLTTPASDNSASGKQKQKQGGEQSPGALPPRSRGRYDDARSTMSREGSGSKHQKDFYRRTLPSNRPQPPNDETVRQSEGSISSRYSGESRHSGSSSGKRRHGRADNRTWVNKNRGPYNKHGDDNHRNNV